MNSQKVYPVTIVGAGPTGLSLALGLARKGIRVLLVEMKTELDSHSRATVIHCRTLEIFAQLSILHLFLAEGERVPHVHLELPTGERIVHFDFTELIDETDTAFALAIPQDKTERILLDEISRTGLVDVRFGHEVVRFEISEDGVDLEMVGPNGSIKVKTQFLIGADGAHSRVREVLGLELRGKTYSTRVLLADVCVEASFDRTGVWPTLLNHAGFISAIRFGHGLWRIIEQSVDDSVNEETIDDHVRAVAAELFGAPPAGINWRKTRSTSAASKSSG